MNTRQHLDQRRLTGAVVTYQRHHLAGLDLEIDSIQRHDPVEAGLLFACKLKTDIDFLGRRAVEQAKAAGPQRRLISFSVDDAEAMLWGGELVLRDGLAAGQGSSAARGGTTGTPV